MRSSFRIVVVFLIIGILVVLVWAHQGFLPDTEVPYAIEPSDDRLVYTTQDFGFSFKYPKEFELREDLEQIPWEFGAFMNIRPLVRIAIPKVTMQGTNLSEAGIDVVATRDARAVAECLVPSEFEAHGEKVIGGQVFTAFTQSGAGAGNFYEIASYRRIAGDSCLVFDLFIHSTSIDNYDPAQGIREFDRNATIGALESIVNTYTVIPR
jgi:hypothetical protein